MIESIGDFMKAIAYFCLCFLALSILAVVITHWLFFLGQFLPHYNIQTCYYDRTVKVCIPIKNPGLKFQYFNSLFP